MATIRRRAIGGGRSAIGCLDARSLIASRHFLGQLFFAFCLLPFALLLFACTSTRPVVKIGLLAPFEGLYRQEGYAALASMRVAIQEQSPPGIDVLPLALDTSRDVARTAQEAMVDPAVVAVIGPYWVGDGAAVASLWERNRWLRPYAPTENDGWAAVAVARAAAYAEREGRTLLLAGRGPGWPQMDVEMAAKSGDVQAGQAVLWLGDAAAGADFALAVWKQRPGAPFGLYSAGAETFRRRVGEKMGGAVFLVGWIDERYAAWARNHSPHTPAAYTVYRQTADTLDRLAGATPATRWQAAIFLLDADGALVLSSGR